MKRKIIALLLSVTCLSLMTACNRSDSAKASPEPVSEAEVAVTEAPEIEIENIIETEPVTDTESEAEPEEEPETEPAETDEESKDDSTDANDNSDKESEQAATTDQGAANQDPSKSEEPAAEAKKEEPAKEAKSSDYTTIYKVVPNDGTWYVSNDGMTAKFFNDSLGKFAGKTAYTLDGLRLTAATSGQIIDNGDGTIKIACCGCCASVEPDLGIISYMGAQTLARNSGYNTLLRTENGLTWIDPRQDTYTHNFDWYYFTY